MLLQPCNSKRCVWCVDLWSVHARQSALRCGTARHRDSGRYCRPRPNAHKLCVQFHFVLKPQEPGNERHVPFRSPLKPKRGRGAAMREALAAALTAVSRLALRDAPACNPPSVPAEDRCAYVLENADACWPEGGLQRYLVSCGGAGARTLRGRACCATLAVAAASPHAWSRRRRAGAPGAVDTNRAPARSRPLPQELHFCWFAPQW